MEESDKQPGIPATRYSGFTVGTVRRTRADLDESRCGSWNKKPSGEQFNSPSPELVITGEMA
jgi:hypothetical protein